ncbi:flagellar hook-associated protein FlgL [Pigmentiphaga soli]|uniref:Flagellar hook-associated protein FlgL n=1 Tax=Pigmentiphaga soli TaxID=1007095 RepID=A0ABP8GNV9_9BURK
MRISTNQFYDASIRSITDQQSALLKVSQQLSAQRTLLNPADDPVAAGREVALDASLSLSNQMVKNQADVRSQLQQTENYIQHASDVLQSFQSRMVQGGSGILAANERQSIATDLSALRDELLGVANTQDENGNYVFAGYKRDTRPFVQTADGVVYQGDGGVRQSQIGPDRFIDTNFSGTYLFDNIPGGKGGLTVSAGDGNMGSLLLNGISTTDRDAWQAASAAGPFTVTFGADGAYSVADGAGEEVSTGTLAAGAQSLTVNGATVTFTGTPADGDTLSIGASGNASIFDSLDKAIAALQMPDSPQESVRRANALFSAGLDIDAGFSRALEARTAIGTRINEIDAATNADTARGDAVQDEISRVVGSDISTQTELTGELAKRTYTVQAAQLTYTRVSQLSIFDYL